MTSYNVMVESGLTLSAAIDYEISVNFSNVDRLNCCHVCILFSLVPYREAATESGIVKRKPYSPFQPKLDNVADFALARIDDLVNWARKVTGRLL